MGFEVAFQFGPENFRGLSRNEALVSGCGYACKWLDLMIFVSVFIIHPISTAALKYLDTDYLFNCIIYYYLFSLFVIIIFNYSLLFS